MPTDVEKCSLTVERILFLQWQENGNENWFFLRLWRCQKFVPSCINSPYYYGEGNFTVRGLAAKSHAALFPAKRRLVAAKQNFSQLEGINFIVVELSWVMSGRTRSMICHITHVRLSVTWQFNHDWVRRNKEHEWSLFFLTFFLTEQGATFMGDHDTCYMKVHVTYAVPSIFHSLSLSLMLSIFRCLCLYVRVWSFCLNNSYVTWKLMQRMSPQRARHRCVWSTRMSYHTRTHKHKRVRWVKSSVGQHDRIWTIFV